MAEHGLALVSEEQKQTVEAKPKRAKRNGRARGKGTNKKGKDNNAASGSPNPQAAQGNGGKEDESKWSPRKRVKKAQLHVLQNVGTIVEGSCASAAGGNYGCAKFVLDWAGVSDLRAPLARPPKSGTSALIKKLKAAMKQAQPAEQELPK